MRTFWKMLGLLFFVAILVNSTAPEGCGGNLAEDCFSDSDCDSSSRCNGGTCLKKIIVTEGECHSKKPCPSGKVCKNQKCVDDGICKADADCAVGEVCRDGKCETKLCACRMNTDCSVGQKCSNCMCVRDGCTPSAEVCDGKDNDCDGLIDEGQVCNTGRCSKNADCAAGEVCSAGKCQAKCACSMDADCASGQKCSNCQCVPFGCTPSKEVCDKKDNDCDGQVDEGGVCGECQSDVDCPVGKACQSGKCVASDVCRSNADCPVGTECLSGKCQKRCFCASDSDCSVGQKCSNCMCVSSGCTPSAEICDGKDNDCDGQVDEGLTRSCSTACGSGKRVCSNGYWTSCSAPKPSKEVCDKKDNDCDGRVDEGGVCSECQSDIDCAVGQICRAGFCVKAPEEEPNLPKDDGGSPDIPEGPRCSSNWDCSVGQRCVSGLCVASNCGTKEICADGKDNDCDGEIDENCPCIPGETRACGSGTGSCRQGVITCLVSLKWSSCVGEVKAKKEVCGDWLDNDCDGKIDEGCKKQCAHNAECAVGEYCVNGTCKEKEGPSNPDSSDAGTVDVQLPDLPDSGLNCSSHADCPPGQACQNGQCVAQHCSPGSKRACGSNTGTCKKGTQTCSNSGNWGSCVGGISAKAEVCKDGLDNDCDGLVDEGCFNLSCVKDNDCPKGQYCINGLCYK